MTLSSISSWMRQKIFDLWMQVFATCAMTAVGAFAETPAASVGPDIGVPMGDPYRPHGAVTDVVERLEADMKLFVTGFEGCSDLVTGPLESGTPRDTLRDTWTVIQKISVECWAFLQLDPKTPVEPAISADLVAPEMIHGIMANAAALSAESEEWAKTLMDFPGGDIICRDALQCRLSLPDGRNPPEQSLNFDLILAAGDFRFIKVTQLVYGRSGFVYGVEWQGTDTDGKVVAIFPELH